MEVGKKVPTLFNRKKGKTLSTIGTLKFDEKKGMYTGQLRTVTISMPITIERVKNKRENGPDFLIYSKAIEIGSAWVRKGQRSGKDYISCAFTAPEFGKAMYANVGKAAGSKDPTEFVLIYNAPNGQ